MPRSFSLFASLAATTLSLFIAAAPAFASGPAYKLVPAAAPKSATIVARDTLWRCGPDACTASQATSRPAVVCASAVREIGPITSFSAKGADFTADELTKCNEKAR